MTEARKERRFRVAVLSVVKHDYLPNAVGAHSRFDLVVVADDAGEPDWAHTRNARFAGEFDIPYVRDVDAALRDFDVDVAVISSTAERHCDLAVRAAEAGLHIVMDKPMSTRLEECDRLLQCVERNGVRCLLWNRNLLPAVLSARKAIAEGKIGHVVAIHCDFYFSKDAGPPLGCRQPDDPPLSWLELQLEAHADGSDGGVGTKPMGELEIEGIYPLAYLRMLTGGARVNRVFARTASHFHQVNADNNVDDLATVSLEMDRGIVGSLCIGRIGAASHPDIGEIKIHVLGSNGALVVSEARPEVAFHYRGQSPLEFRHQRIADDNSYLLVEDFARAIDTGGDTILDARAGRDICATVHAALASGRMGEPVAVSSLGS